MKKIIALLLLCCMLLPAACAETWPQAVISFRADNGAEQVLRATLADNDTARTLALMQDISLLMSDLNGNEKFAYLPQTLTECPQAMEQIHAGDILLFGNKCLVIFYEDAPASFSYSPIGHIDDVNALRAALGTGDVEVRLLFDEVQLP